MSIKVVVKNNNYEKALSIFKRKVKESGIQILKFQNTTKLCGYLPETIASFMYDPTKNDYHQQN